VAPETALETMAAEVTARIAATRVITRPFPHIALDDVLPAPVRRAIDEAWPAPDLMLQTNFGRRRERTVSQLMQITDGRDRAVWRAVHYLMAVASVAIRRKLERHLGDKFRPLIGPDWRRRMRGVDYAPSDCQIAEYRGSIKLDPHVDHARIVVNGFVYLDDPEPVPPEPKRGTMLYSSRGFAWPSNLVIPPNVRQRFLRPEKEIAWQDNRLFAYVNGPWSFHGVDPHDLGDARRRLLMLGTLLRWETVTALFGED
jgi:hypothetical protein